MVVHPASHQIPRVRCYSGYCQPSINFVYGTFTLSGLASQLIILSISVPYAVLYPGCIATSGLASFPFARRYLENLVWFLFLRLLRCFSSAGSPCMTILFIIQCYGIAIACFHIRTSVYLWLFAPPHSFSQLVTSFFGSWCLGILPTLLLAWPKFRTNLIFVVFVLIIFLYNQPVTPFFFRFHFYLWCFCIIQFSRYKFKKFEDIESSKPNNIMF